LKGAEFRRFFALFFVALCACSATSAQSAPSIPPPVKTYVAELGKSGFSGSILVERGGEVFVRSYGMADYEFSIPNTPATKFKIGSVTKQFTAAAMLLLVKDGKLSLEDPVCKFVSDCPASWRPITVRELLNHSSGIADFVKLPGMRDRFTLPMKLDQTIATLERQPLDFAPGSDAQYGNSGFLISASIIQQLSGKSYADFLDQRIYRPLGMKDSGYAADGPVIPNRARGYVRRDGAIENAPYIDMSIPIGAGSQYSTALDLYRWDRALRSNGLLPAALRKQMFTPGKGGFGLGWEMADDHGRRVAEHVGDINGFGAFIARWLDDDAVIIILSNIEGTKNVRDIRDRISEMLFH
jgi:CubicO group peptidase (beta-lactamase class C family)